MGTMSNEEKNAEIEQLIGELQQWQEKTGITLIETSLTDAGDREYEVEPILKIANRVKELRTMGMDRAQAIQVVVEAVKSEAVRKRAGLNPPAQ